MITISRRNWIKNTVDLRTSCARIGDRPILDPPEKHVFRFQIKKLKAIWYLLQIGLPKNVFNSISPNMDLQTSCTQVFNCTMYHLAQLIPRRFLKPAVCKYQTIVNNSEIYILLPKPCPWMWHLMCGNRVRNGSDRKSETGKTRSLKLALLKKSYRRCAVILPCGHARIHWINTRTPTRQAVSATPKTLCSSSVSSLIPQHTVHKKKIKSATFGERTRRISGLLYRPFLTRFPCTRCHVKEYGVDNKMYISDLITVFGYLHTAGFKNRRGIDFAKCIFLKRANVVWIIQ